MLPCPARSRSKGVPTAPISASMPRLPRQKLTLSKDLYPSPPEHPTARGSARPPHRPLEGILARLTGCVGYLSVTCSCAAVGLSPHIQPEFSPVSLFPALLILTLLPLPFAWHLPIDTTGTIFSTKVVKKRMSRSQLGVTSTA